MNRGIIRQNIESHSKGSMRMIVQSRYRERYNKTIPVGDIAEGLCTESLRSTCYREVISRFANRTET